MTEILRLKWGTYKGYSNLKPASIAILERYAALGYAAGAMQQNDTPEQKDILCELIDQLDAETIRNDWTGKDMTKEEAKKYILEYGKV